MELKKHGVGQDLGWSGESRKATHDVTLYALSKFPGDFTANTEGDIITHQPDDTLVDYALLSTTELSYGPLTAIKQLELNLKKFERYVNVTGGRLIPEKCLYQYLYPV